MNETTSKDNISNAPWPSATAAWYTVFVLSLTALINFLDRGILALLVPEIKQDLNLSDTEMGIIMGFAFVLFYVLAGLPIARYADRGNRRNLMVIGLALWGGATALCGLAKSFGSLFLFRVGVGVGEACTGPATFSILGDYFRPEKLARAIGVMNIGMIAGNGLALLIGGGIIAFLSSMPPVHLPFYGELQSWQLTLLLVGTPGLFIALLMLTVKEPPRRVLGEPPSVKTVIAYLTSKRWIYVPLIVGFALNTVAAVGNSSWGPVFFMRTYGWGMGKIAFYLGIMLMLFMPVGAMLGGMISEKLMKVGYADANMRIVMAVQVLVFLPHVLYPLMSSPEMALVLSGLGMFLGGIIIGPQNAAIQMITPNRMRGQITAVMFFGFNVIGFGLGPVLLALVTDYVFQDESQIRFALSSVYAVTGPIAFGILWLGLKPYRAEVEKMKIVEQQKN